MSSIGYLFKEGLKNVWNNRIMSIASVGVLISCLILTGAAALLSINVESIVDSVGQSNETNVYLEDGVTEFEAVYIGKDIEKISNVASAEFYSKDDAIEQYKDELGDELFANMQGDDNPLPDSYIVAMEDLSLYDETVEEIMAIDGVEEVSNHSEIAQRLTDISNLVNLISFGVVLALMIISLFIIANTIRATMYSRRFEISVMKSVGATNSFVRMPFLVEGMTIGLVSAVLSTGAVALLYEGVMAAIQQLIPFTAVPLGSIILYVAVVFVIAGVVIGGAGSWISIRKYLKKEGNEILGW
ncbi:MAG: permease-like cell division protein FtsX [Clostridiales bacterium]|nr:permease-like cell division protein FtsX [Clostridiales bacterium]